jgi:hypothetical protein
MDDTALSPTAGKAREDADHRAPLIKWTYGLINRIAMVVDAACLLGGTFMFWALSPPDERPLTWLQAGAVAATITIIFHMVIRGTRSYRVERYERFHRSLFYPLAGLIPASFPAMLIVVAFLPNALGDADWLLYWIAAAYVSLVAGRQLVRLILHVIRRKGLLRRRVVVVGTGP